MCSQLIQIYACNHAKRICLTPCSHALRSTHQQHQPTTPSPITLTPPQTPLSPPPAVRPIPTAQLIAPDERPPFSSATHISLCPHPFPHPLPQSQYPCLACYLQPAFRGQRERWVKEYRMLHPGTARGELEGLSGVGLIAQRVGLVNVGLEMRGEGEQREG